MSINLQACRKILDEFKLGDLFVEHLGWDQHNSKLKTSVDGHEYALSAIAHKRGFTAYVCDPGPDGRIPDHPTRGRIDTYVTKSAREHIIIYANRDHSEQLWQWVRRAPGQPIARREYPYRRGQTGGMLIERVLPNITFGLAEEDGLSIVDVTTRARAGFDVEKVTKRFYDRFKTEHEAFCKFLKGIPDDSLQSWYVSVMLNRLMFIYFIQKKHFLDNDADYLKNRLAVVRKKGKDRYYREFLCPLFFEGFAKRPNERSAAARSLLGTVPYLNGGLFLRHQIEERHGQTIQIPDAAFERLFEFFDGYRWHLDERPLRANNEINPDVLGYIFEKYINQKQMGAYYTKEDITEYISKSTIIPFLFDAARKECAIAFKPDSAVWRLLRDNPDQYIYEAVRRGVIDHTGKVIPESVLPDFVQKGMKDPKARMFDKRYNLGTAEIPGPDGQNLALPTETWREYVARRQRCLELREKLRKGEVHEINDLITLNLDIRQFAEDVIATSEGPELVRAFWKAIERVTVLDPTCGSGAFLFAALNILEPLYEACLNRMAGLLDDLKRSGEKHHPEKFSDFRKVLDRIALHPNHRYFVLKSIIINNLFGVDIMEEATEICKLRLFLKLVAQIERVEQIEPLPDIDFNIRAGNTLVGFATLDEVRRAVTQDAKHAGQNLMQFDDTLSRIEEQARLVDTAFRKFREMQTDQGVTPAELAEGKEMVRSRMTALDAQLDRYLAGEYAISPATIPDKKKYADAFQTWRKTHEPFHWFVDFYGIMSTGGFDVVIGNPPYINAAKVRRSYTVHGLRTTDAPDVYAWVMERNVSLLLATGRTGMIVPLSLGFSRDFDCLRAILFGAYQQNWFSSFGRIPSALFSFDVRVRNTIHIGYRAGRAENPQTHFSTRLHRWFDDERQFLFAQLHYSAFTPEIWRNRVPKLDSQRLCSELERCFTESNKRIADGMSRSATKHTLLFKSTAYNWLNFCKRLPPCYDTQGNTVEHTQFTVTFWRTGVTRDAAFVLLNSKLAFVLWCILGDDFHVTQSALADVPCDLDRFVSDNAKQLTPLVDELEKAMKHAVSFKLNAGKRVGNYNLALCRHVTHSADAMLAKHLGLSGVWDDVEEHYSKSVRTEFDEEE
ncbi:MAG: hypothetical protein BroJett003_23520 [Planctomycetota bacterium]|nr:MAG: hypothetical protein BroJett003_23520 [Planctomycetota bacterium]